MFFLVPLVLFPKTSEIFEFNKMVFVYASTIVIVSLWVLRMIVERKIIFRRTLLDIPLLLFLLSLAISTILSVDPRTSLLGYYSRFHGGLFSSITYCLLYWAYVANIDQKTSKKVITVTLISAIIVAVYGTLQRVGIDKHLWDQKVQERVFSTFGQPNWLGAWLAAILPITWAFILKIKLRTKLSALGLLTLLTTVLLFTKSRSALIGFSLSFLIFWGFQLVRSNVRKKVAISFIIVTSTILFAMSVIGTPWTAGFVGGKPNVTQLAEPGGTESGEIRKLVWQGAIDIWKSKPLFGTGVETFAYYYHQFRPAEHNLTSEWEYIYNKAHNEYLSILSNTGLVGLLAYVSLIVSTLILLTRLFKKERNLIPALLAGYLSILVTNFFGFSVVPVAILFFLYPAIAVTLKRDGERVKEYNISILPTIQKISEVVITFLALLLFYSVARYWYADYLYTQARILNAKTQHSLAHNHIIKALKLSSYEPLFYSAASEITAALALQATQMDDLSTATYWAEEAIALSETAINLSPRNLIIRKNIFKVHLLLTSLGNNYLVKARIGLEDTLDFAPTDAKINYNLGLSYARTNETKRAIKTLEKTIKLKDNYADARFALALLLINQGEKLRAKEQLVYILENIEPNNELVKFQLSELEQ